MWDILCQQYIYRLMYKPHLCQLAETVVLVTLTFMMLLNG